MQKKHFVLPKIYCLIFVFAALAASGCFPTVQHEEYITIGALFPLTGSSSDAGHRAINGLHLAVEEINADGGILGKKLDVIVLNDKGDEEEIVRQYGILKEKKVIAVIGSNYSNMTLALAKAAEADGIPIISPTASHPEITQGRKNVFRAIFLDDHQAEVMAEFAYHTLNTKTVVAFRNTADDGFGHLTEVFAKTFEDFGGKMTAVEPYDSDDDFAEMLEKYRTAPPDAFYCPDDFIPASKLVNTVYEMGLGNIPLLGSDAWDGLLIYAVNTDAMNNVYFPAPFAIDDDDPIVARFVKDFYTAFSQTPLTDSANTYTCVYILAEAVKKAGSTNAEDIIAAMKTNELHTVIGRIKFDENNNPNSNVYVTQIKGGVYSTYKKIER